MTEEEKDLTQLEIRPEFKMVFDFAAKSALGVSRSGAAAAFDGGLFEIMAGAAALLASVFLLFIFSRQLAAFSKTLNNPKAFLFAVAIGASASFATPIGYQTNLMVYGPGGYKFKDYLKVGIPMNIFIGIIAIATIYLIYFI